MEVLQRYSNPYANEAKWVSIEENPPRHQKHLFLHGV